MDERPNLAKAAVDLLDDLRREYTAVQITMLLAAARQLHTIDHARTASIDQIIRGDHIDQELADR